MRLRVTKAASFHPKNVDGLENDFVPRAIMLVEAKDFGNIA